MSKKFARYALGSKHGHSEQKKLLGRFSRYIYTHTPIIYTHNTTIPWFHTVSGISSSFSHTVLPLKDGSIRFGWIPALWLPPAQASLASHVGKRLEKGIPEKIIRVTRVWIQALEVYDLISLELVSWPYKNTTQDSVKEATNVKDQILLGLWTCWKGTIRWSCAERTHQPCKFNMCNIYVCIYLGVRTLDQPPLHTSIHQC